jgi:phosphoenolpyruvate synthase/pyruvate phosphate dikinase
LEKGGTREEEIETTIVGVQKLSDEHILELAKYAERIEKHYGKPMDIERAVEDGELFILQARPITTLENKEKAENNDIYINDFIAKIKNVDRDVQRFNAYPFFISSVATVSGFDLPWGLSYTHFFCISHAENVQWHYDNADYTRL